ncbi:MAG: hypothetical protein ABI895_23305 [Deltaproteobacteria bacterium]
MPAGGYSLTATSARFRGGPLWVNVGVGEKAEGLRLVVHAATAVTVQATIVGQPCRDGQVLLATTPRAFGAFDADGVARLLGVLPGSYALTAFCRDALARTEQVTVGAEAMGLAWALASGLGVRVSCRAPLVPECPESRSGCWRWLPKAPERLPQRQFIAAPATPREPLRVAV